MKSYIDWLAEDAYVGMSSISGMGPIVAPQPGATPGMTGSTGSGDLATTVFPVQTKRAPVHTTTPMGFMPIKRKKKKKK